MDSLLPDRALHDLSIPEDCIVLLIVEQGGPKDGEMEDLVTGSAEIKLPRCTPLRTPDYVYDSSLYVDVATHGISESGERRDVLIHEGEHDKHGGSR